MPKLFEPIRVGKLELSNRIIMAPMTRSRADDAGVQPAFVAEYYRQRASAGLIITEATNVSPMAKGYIRTPGIYTAEQIESWRRVTGRSPLARRKNLHANFSHRAHLSSRLPARGRAAGRAERGQSERTEFHC